MNRCIDKMKPSASVQLMAKAKQMQKTDPGIINLAGGEPDFPTPEKITVAAIRSLTNGNTHYTVGAGIPELRQAIAKKLQEKNGIICSADCIAVTPGGKNAIYLALQALLNHGEEVIVLNPAWVSYEPAVIAAGGESVRVDLDLRDNYRITAQALENAWSEKTRVIIINYPNNPTGRVLHQDEADILEAFLLKHPEVYLLSDEIYEAIVFDGNRSISMGSYASICDRVITVNGFSKSVAMTGWRMGYLAASAPVFKAIYKLYQHSITCMNSFTQVGAVEAFSCQQEIEQMRKVYEYRRDMLVEALNAIPGVRFVSPEGAFYAWVEFDVNGMTSAQMSEYLLEQARVVGVPGDAYGEERMCCLRFSFATATEDLRTAAQRIKKAIEKLREGE